MLNKKLVYFDSSHISRIADNDPFLIEIVRRKDIIICISATHYVEAIPDDYKNAQAIIGSQARLDAIKGFKNKIYLKPLHYIIELVDKKITVDKILITSNSSPFLLESIVDGNELFDSSSLSEVKNFRFVYNQLDLNEKRKFRAQIRKQKKVFCSKIKIKSYPLLSLVCGKGLYEWIFGEVEDAIIGRKIVELMLNESFWLFDKRSLEGFTLNIGEVIEAFRGMESFNFDFINDYIKFFKLNPNLTPEFIKFQALFINRFIKVDKESKIFYYTRSGMYTFIECLYHKIYRKIHINSGKKSEFLKNDINDAMHCAYIPYVDIFCADAATKLALRDSIYAHKIISSDDEMKTVLNV
jgi:hypothetical protein